MNRYTTAGTNQAACQGSKVRISSKQECYDSVTRQTNTKPSYFCDQCQNPLCRRLPDGCFRFKKNKRDWSTYFNSCGIKSGTSDPAFSINTYCKPGGAVPRTRSPIAPPTAPRTSEPVEFGNASMHIIFSTDCTSFQDWQSLVLFHSATRVNQPGLVRTITHTMRTYISTQQEHAHRSLALHLDAVMRKSLS